MIKRDVKERAYKRKETYLRKKKGIYINQSIF